MIEPAYCFLGILFQVAPSFPAYLHGHLRRNRHGAAEPALPGYNQSPPPGSTRFKNARVSSVLDNTGSTATGLETVSGTLTALTVDVNSGGDAHRASGQEAAQDLDMGAVGCSITMHRSGFLDNPEHPRPTENLQLSHIPDPDRVFVTPASANSEYRRQEVYNGSYTLDPDGALENQLDVTTDRITSLDIHDRFPTNPRIELLSLETENEKPDATLDLVRLPCGVMLL